MLRKMTEKEKNNKHAKNQQNKFRKNKTYGWNITNRIPFHLFFYLFHFILFEFISNGQ